MLPGIVIVSPAPLGIVSVSAAHPFFDLWLDSKGEFTDDPDEVKKFWDDTATQNCKSFARQHGYIALSERDVVALLSTGALLFAVVVSAIRLFS